MSTLSDCCSPCPSTPPVNIPGVAGPAGVPGTPGSDGTDAFSIVQAPGFTIPTVGNDVLIPVNSTAWLAVGQIVICSTGFGGPVTGPANFRVITLNSSTTFTGRALAYTGDAVNPTAIAASALVTAAGLQGPSGASLPTTTAGDVIYNTNGVAGAAARLGIGAQGQALVADPSNAVPASIIAWKSVSQTINTNISTVGTGADLTEDNLMSFSVAANTLRNLYDSLEWEVLFNVAITASVAAKIIKVYFGASVIAQFGSAALDGGSIVMRGTIIRSGAVNQLAFGSYVTTDSAGVATTKMVQSSPGETLSGAVLFKCTGQNVTNAIANGIQQQALKINYRAA